MSGQSIAFDEFEAQLTHVLQHLYDPSLHPAEVVFQVIGLSVQDGIDALQTALIQQVEDLRPADYVPKTARSWRMYSILYYRFVSNLPQEEVADKVAITPRHLRREQAAAIRILARKFWERAQLPAPADTEEHEEPISESTPAPTSETGPNPDVQLQNDLMALQENAPGVISDVTQVIRSVLALVRRVPAGKNLRSGPIHLTDGLRAALHPSALRQVLWMIIHQAINAVPAGELRIESGEKGDRAYIHLSVCPAFAFEQQRLQTIAEILSLQRGTLEIDETVDCTIFRVELLSVNRTVLVVDDNPDIVHLYQRYLVGSPYHLVHLARGQELFERIEDLQPDILVLDIMLPDVDGWDLLTRLTEDPETRRIPVVVCSVVSDPELALALGARASLSKPVQHQEFIRALNQVSGLA